MKAIVYTTNAGSTEQYAKLLAQKTGLPVYSLAKAKRMRFHSKFRCLPCRKILM